ncbi:MAG: response regulator transcription factor [Elusimicrobia bacterium]|nr:response regulator transcription factor [Elusimicrobiota bacterium]
MTPTAPAEHKVLLIAPASAVYTGLVAAFLKEGWKAAVSSWTEPDVLARVRADTPEVLVLPARFSGVSGLTICRAIRAEDRLAPMGLLLLADGNAGEGPAYLLGQGADDCLKAATPPEDVVAKVKALLRRGIGRSGGAVSFGPISLDLGRREALVSGRKAQPLTPKEFDLLKLLLTHPRRVFSHAWIANRVWGDKPSSILSLTLHAHIYKLRRKLGREAGRYLQNRAKAGYVLDKPRRSKKRSFPAVGQN